MAAMLPMPKGLICPGFGHMTWVLLGRSSASYITQVPII